MEIWRRSDDLRLQFRLREFNKIGNILCREVGWWVAEEEDAENSTLCYEWQDLSAELWALEREESVLQASPLDDARAKRRRT